MNGLSLYEIAADYRRMVAALMQTDADAQAVADTIEGESFPLEMKAQNVAYAIKNLVASAEAIKGAEAEMYARRKAIENRAQSIKDYLLSCMELAGVQQIACPHFAINVRANPPSVHIDCEQQIPVEFWTQPEPPPPTPNKKAIAEALKAGDDVPGARLSRGKRLDIK